MSIARMEFHPRSYANECFRLTKQLIGSVGKTVVKCLESREIDLSTWANKTIAIVGNAPMDCPFGSEIDSADFVMRCNKGISNNQHNNPRYVGIKTDYCLIGGLSAMLDRGVRTHIMEHPELRVGLPFTKESSETSLNALTAMLIFGDRIDFLSSDDANRIGYNLSKGVRPSTGFVAINILKKFSPGNISLYGFGFSDFNRIDNRRNYTTQHDFASERRSVERLSNDGILIVKG